MAQIFRLKDLRERKLALLAECEVYRQTLKLEVQNIRLYQVRMRRKFDLLRFANPLFLLAGSWVGSRLLGRKSRWRRRRRISAAGLGLMAWRLFRTYGPLLQRLFFPPGSSQAAAGREKAGDDMPAARI